jgi:hypothetical protein
MLIYPALLGISVTRQEVSGGVVVKYRTIRGGLLQQDFIFSFDALLIPNYCWLHLNNNILLDNNILLAFFGFWSIFLPLLIWGTFKATTPL